MRHNAINSGFFGILPVLMPLVRGCVYVKNYSNGNVNVCDFLIFCVGFSWDCGGIGGQLGPFLGFVWDFSGMCWVDWAGGIE